MVVFSTAKAAKAFAIGLVMSGLAVACNEAGQVAKTIAPEAEAVNADAGKGLQGAQLTAEERETKKREFLAKPEVKEMSAGLEEIAEAVAVAVEDKELRDRIYAKCMEKFDGETNVLWQHLEGDNTLRSKGGWNKRIDDLVSKGRKNTVVKGVGNVDAAIKKFEKVFGAPLHLFWMYPSKWDKKTAPLVAFVPMDMDPALRKSIPMFDSKGNKYELDQACTIAKERPVVIVNFNERTYLDGRKKALGYTTSHEQASNGVFVSQNSPGKGSTRLTSSLNHIIEQVTITYPYNRDEWGGGVEFWVVHFVKAKYGPNKEWRTEPVNSFMLPGENLENTSTDYRFINQSVSLTTTISGSDGIVYTLEYYEFSCQYFEADGAFFLDDFIASHNYHPMSFSSTGYTASHPREWWAPAVGGTVSAVYRLSL